MQCLACDFGGSSVKYALVDHRARMRDNGCCPAPLDSLTAFLDCLAQLYARFSGQAAGIALSLPGFIDAERGLHLGSGAYGPILKQQFVAKLVSARCGVPVSMENDGRCGALAELWDGALAGARDGAVLILGTASAAASSPRAASSGAPALPQASSPTPSPPPGSTAPSPRPG